MNLNAKKLPLLTAMLGLIALMLRACLSLFGTDEKGLLVPWHVLDILCWILTAGMLLIAIFSLGNAGEAGRSNRTSLPAALGSFALAAGIAATVLGSWNIWPRLDLLRNLCGLLAVPSLIWAGLCRRQGMRPFFAFHAVPCLYLTLYTISHYQTWCSRPQLQDYVFPMAGVIFLALFSYYHTASDVDMVNPRPQQFTGLMAGYCCLAAMSGMEDSLLYLGGAFWALTNLSSPAPAVRRRPNPVTQSLPELQKEEF